MTYFKRITEARLLGLASTFPCVIVTGGRQAGKTTLLRHLFPDYRFAVILGGSKLYHPGKAHLLCRAPSASALNEVEVLHPVELFV